MKHATLIILAVFAVAMFASGAHAQTAAKVELKSYDVSLAMLEVPVTLKDEAGKSQTFATAYMVRLHGTFPANTAKLFELYVGNHRIGEYGGLPDGIYFMVFEKKALDQLAGKKFGYRFGGNDIKPLGVKFEPGKFPTAAAIPEKDAMTR